jgi:hypothetical protein
MNDIADDAVGVLMIVTGFTLIQLAGTLVITGLIYLSVTLLRVFILILSGM